MTVIEKINIKPIKLESQKIKECTEFYLELRDNSIQYCIRFYADEPVDENDKTLGWETIFNCFKTVARKSNVAGIEKTYTKYKYWGIYIMVSGFANDMKLFFKRESEAQELFEKLNKWLHE
jgi:hypothetical protein